MRRYPGPSLRPSGKPDLSQCKKSAIWTLRSKLRGKLNRNLCIFMQEKYLKMSGNWRPIFLHLNMLKWLHVNFYVLVVVSLFPTDMIYYYIIKSYFGLKYISHDDVIKWKHFPRYWPLVRGIHGSQRPVTRSFDIFFDLCLNERLSKW